jgi:pheromone shutdown protein TraB
VAKQIEELIDQQFSKMSFEEKLEFIKSVRKSRATPKATSKVVRRAKRAKKKQTDKVQDMFAKLSPEEKAKLIEELTK